MDILVLGAGNVGEAIAYDLHEDFEVHAGDVDEDKLKNIEKYAETEIIDASADRELKERMKDFDLIICSLPGRFGFRTVKKAIEAGVDIVDVSFMPEDPLQLNDEARRNDVTAVVDAGFGPGISNVLMGRIAEELSGIKDCKIRIGGLPKKKVPPLYYKLTWSPYDLIEEYIRDARVIRDGKIVSLDPFEEISGVELAGHSFEEFYSDGLRTLLHTIDAGDMEETTLRWEGHLDKIKVLRELGFFEEEKLEDTLDVISHHMDYESEDFSMMDIRANDGEGEQMRYHFYDEADDMFSSMSRSTGFATATMARLIIDEETRDGVIPPEEFGRVEERYDLIIDRMRSKGIQIERK